MEFQYPICMHITEMFERAFPDETVHISNMYNFLNEQDLSGFDVYTRHLSSYHRHFIVTVYETMTDKFYVERCKERWNRYKNYPACIERILLIPLLLIVNVIFILGIDTIFDFLIIITSISISYNVVYRSIKFYHQMDKFDKLFDGDVIRYVPIDYDKVN